MSASSSHPAAPSSNGASAVDAGPVGFLMTLRQLLPRVADYDGLRTSWRGDVLAGATVAVVALPLALAFGITSSLGA